MPTTTGVATTFIDFTRASNATVTDSDGLVKWAPHNLLLASESFDAAAWTKSAGVTTVTANAVAAPNGTQTADLITSGVGDGYAYQTVTLVAGVTYTFSVWLKAQSPSSFATVLQIYNASDTGTTQTVNVTSDWQMFSLTKTVTQSSSYLIFVGGSSTLSSENLYAWGASLYRSDLAMQPNTSAYPLYNPTTPKNLLGFTESLTTGWTNSNTTDAIVSEVNPVGLTGAVDVAATAGNGTLLGSLSLLASPYTFSIWLKRKTGSGTVEITVDGTTYVAAAVTSTWTRFSATLTPAAGTKTPGIRLVTSGDAVYAWGAQLSDSASLDSYVPVYGAAVTSAAYYGPRRDFDGATLACKGLLVEEQRANLLTYSSEFDNAAWSKAGATAGPYAGVSPDGAATAEKILETATTGSHAFYNFGLSISAAAQTLSVYLRAAERTWAKIAIYDGTTDRGAWFNLSTGAVGTKETGVTAEPAVAVGNGWYRCSITRTTVSGTGGPGFYAATADNVSSYAGTLNSGILVWGAQLEANASFATSYIPVGSTSAGATRLADVASVSTQAFPYNQSEGSAVVNATLGNTSTNGPVALTINDGTGSNEIYTLQIVGTGTRRSGLIYVGGAPQAILSESLTNTVGLTTKAAFAFKLNDVAGSIDGGTVLIDTPPALIPTVNTMRIGNVAAGTQAFNGWIRQITYLPRRISNAELVTRST